MSNNSSLFPLSSEIEALLFFKAEPLSEKELCTLTGAPIAEVRQALDDLDEKLAGRGVSLLRVRDTAALETAKEAAPLIEKVTKEELSRDIGKAGLETLSIILYKGEAARRDIDFIRGVNSTFIIRNLLIRGLIERVEGKDKRTFLYRPTVELLSHLGMKSLGDLPEREVVLKELEELFGVSPQEVSGTKEKEHS